MSLAVPSPIVMDTDIGSDIDDALALLLLLHLQDTPLLGVTTVYGNVLLRAKIAQRILLAAGRDVPVVVGTGTPMDSPFPIWHTGEEGVGLLSDREMRPATDGFHLCDNAPRFLVEQIMRSPGQVTLLAIGALTNVALALEMEPRLRTAIRRVVFMGTGVTYPNPVPEGFRSGDEYVAAPSHNVRCDVEAARRVFHSGVRISALTNDVTTRVWWDGATVRQLLQARKPPEVKAVASLLDVWLKYRTRVFGRPISGTCPHDPLTVAEAVQPGQFVKYQSGSVTIHRDGSTSFVAEPAGPHELGVQVDAEGFLEWLAPRLLRNGLG